MERLLSDTQRALRSVGLEIRDLALLRIGTNVVFESVANDVIVRVAATDRNKPAAAERHLHLVDRLCQQGAPFVPPKSLNVVTVDEGHYATLWSRGQNTEVTTAEFAGLLAATHEMPVPDGELPAWQWRPKVERRLLQAQRDGVPSDLLAPLHRQLERLQATQLPSDQQRLLHGDAHAGNIVRWQGGVRFVDLDDLCTGGIEFDIAKVRVATRRFQTGLEWPQFVRHYPHPLPEERLEHACQIKELTMNTWLASLWSARPETRTELRRRVSEDGAHSNWTPM